MDFFKKFVLALLVVMVAVAYVDAQGLLPKNCTEENGQCLNSDECCPEQGCQNTIGTGAGQCKNCTRSENPCINNTNCCECTTERCIRFKCQLCSLRGTYCAADNDCCGSPNDECRHEKCSRCTLRGEPCGSHGPCCKNNFCCNGICETCLGVGITCTTDESCCSGYGCISGVCKQCNVKCSTDSQCPCADSACLKETCEACFVLGQPCKKDAQCCSAAPNCLAQRCDHCASEGQRCSSHRGCCRSTPLVNSYCFNQQCRPWPNTTLPVKCLQPVELAIVLDRSYSTGSSGGYEIAKQFISSFIGAFLGQSRISFIVFASKHQVVIPINNTVGIAGLRRLIDSAPDPPTPGTSGGSTATDLAIDAAVVQLTRYTKGLPRRMLVITDGKSDMGDKTLAAADKAKRNGMFQYAVGIDIDIHGPELLRIAGGSERRTILLPNWDALPAIAAQLSVLVCDE